MNKRQKKKNNKRPIASYTLLKKYFAGSPYYMNIFLGAQEKDKPNILIGSSIKLSLKDMKGREFKIYHGTWAFNLIIVLTDTSFYYNRAFGRYLLIKPISYYEYNGNVLRVYEPYTFSDNLIPYTQGNKYE